METFDVTLHNGVVRPFTHRGTEADKGCVSQIFQNQDYSLMRLSRGAELFALHEKILAAGKTPLIVDAGANHGASTVWLSTTYPRSHVIAFEPDHDNFSLIQLNTVGLDVDLREAAIGSCDGAVSLVDPGWGEWGYRTTIGDTGTIPLVSMSRVVKEKKEGGMVPFIVKIDIEGGEKNLFDTQTDWISDFPLLIIELHDWLMPTQQTSLPFLRCIGSLNRDFVYHGENIFSVANEFGNIAI